MVDYIDSVKCICCGFEIKELDKRFKNQRDNPENSMWDGGTVERIHMPYGSLLDGDIYIIGLCDECIKKNEERIFYMGDYLNPSTGKFMADKGTGNG